MQTLIIDRKDSVLSLQDKRLRIEIPGQRRPQYIPLTMVERVVITAGVNLHSGLLSALAAAGAGVLILSPRDHRRTAMVLPPYGHDHALRLQQYRVVSDEAQCCAIAAAMVRMKLTGQRRTLRMLTHRGQHNRAALRALPELTARLRNERNLSLETIRGIEGGAASLYFQSLAEDLPASLGFTTRKRRPPPDPVNALLSLSYTLLHFDAVRTLLTSGFDPCLGFLHCAQYSRESLACDCIEPLRPLVDRWVLKLFRSRIIRAESFAMQQGACRLGKAGRREFYMQWEQFAPLPRKALQRGVRLLRDAVRIGVR
ncbi:MAG: CRISPR-associated endonuclease Cas1 [Mariprofundales bacterium]|nr:CRISPR-associated endonuclease Cas1 [Mariprofundales bacterium]